MTNELARTFRTYAKQCMNKHDCVVLLEAADAIEKLELQNQHLRNQIKLLLGESTDGLQQNPRVHVVKANGRFSDAAG